MKKEQTATVKGYKVFNPDFKCKGYQYEENTTYTFNGEIKICNSGFHFCIKASHCFGYYSFDSNNIVCEVEGIGKIITHEEDSKICTDKIRIGRKLTWAEVLMVANEGKDNTGHSNTGDSNTGDSNTGDSNTGDSNTGYSNTGDRNTGDSNTGDSNTGSRNTGDSNTGYSNTGYSNTGDSNTGSRNTGDSNTGDSNTGDRNTGYRNTGDRNTGYSNTGDSNTGSRNTGDSNTGSRNTGDSNTGYRNTGDSNTGYSNTGDRNTGAFCTGEPAFTMFNKPSKTTAKEFLNSSAWNLMQNYVDTKLWIPDSKMTDEEKKNNTGWKNAEGYYKDIPFKEAFKNAWGNFDAKSRKAFTDLENFDKDVFEFITSVRVDE